MLGQRAIERDPLPWTREHGIPAMLYCPLGQDRLMKQRRLRDFAERNAAAVSRTRMLFPSTPALRADGILWDGVTTVSVRPVGFTLTSTIP